MKKFSVALLTCCLLACLIPGDAEALTVAPAIIEIQGVPGQVIEQEIVIVNSDQVDKVFDLSTLKFEAGDEIGTPSFLSYEEDHSGLPEWIDFPQWQIMVPAGGVVATTASIAVPASTKAGGYYAAIVATDPAATSYGQVGVNMQVASLVLLNVQGDVYEQAAILDFIAPDWANRLPISFQYRVQNQGNVHFKPVGSLVVTNMFGSEVARIDANPDQGNILPMSTRQLESLWSRAIVNESGFLAEIKNEWQNFALGRYKATLELSYGDSKDSVAATTYFWVFPWHLTLVAATVIILMVLIGRIKITIRKNV